MDINRRVFIGLAGGCAGAIGVWGVRGLLETLGAPAEDRTPGWPDLKEMWTPSVCRACPAGCGIRGRTVDGSLVRIEGNPLHPINRGGLCPKGLAALQLAYDPDRPLTCGVRSSELGPGRPLRALPPDRGLELLSGRVQAALAARGPQAVAIVEGTGPSGTSLIAHDLARRLGLAGAWSHDPDAGLKLALLSTQGVSSPPACDIARAETVLAFGAGFLEEDGSPVRRALDMADLRSHTEGRRPQVVVLDPRFSMSAARADRWVPLRPGTYGSLALAVAYVVFKENRHRAAFLRDWSEGLEDLVLPDGSRAAGYLRMVMERGIPETVAQETGVPVDTILEIGKQFATSHRAVALPSREVTRHENGVRDAALIHALNALVGSLDVPGGALTPASAPLAATPGDPGIPVPGGNPAGNAEGRLLDIAQGRHPVPDVLVLVEAEPEEWPGTAGVWSELRDRIPFVATVAARPGPSVGDADLVLPAATYLEAWDLWSGPSPVGSPVVGVECPLLPPPGDARPGADWLLDLSRRLATGEDGAPPWNDAEEHTRYRLRGLFEARRGTPFTEDLEEEHIRHLEERGWWVPTHDDPESFLQEVIARGGWWDPYYRHKQYGRILRTTSGRFRFPSESDPPASRKAVSFSDPREQALQLSVFPVLAFMGPGGAELPWLQQNVDLFGRTSWQPWVEINPRTAADLGIDDGTRVEVSNRRGAFRAVARVFEGASPGLINVPLGYSPSSRGRYARGRGGGMYSLLGRKRDPTSGLASMSGTLVRVKAV